MITLRSMRNDEFPAFLDYFIPDYAAEIASNYDIPLASATARAKKEVSRDLGSGVETPGQSLLCIVDEADKVVGYIWCTPDGGQGSVFISEFYIEPAHRGAGLGRLAIAALETYYGDLGMREFRLRVAADNKRAEHLYREAGFQVTGFNMSKRIG